MNLFKQRGVSLSGLIIVLVVLALLGLVGAKTVPAYVDYFNIKKVIASMEAAGELKNMSSKDLRMSYARRASIDNIRSISAEDLLINKGPDGNMVISAEYTVKTALFGNVSLLIDFSVSSTAKSD